MLTNLRKQEVCERRDPLNRWRTQGGKEQLTTGQLKKGQKGATVLESKISSPSNEGIIDATAGNGLLKWSCFPGW